MNSNPRMGRGFSLGMMVVSLMSPSPWIRLPGNDPGSVQHPSGVSAQNGDKESLRTRLKETIDLLERKAPADAIKLLQSLGTEVESTGDPAMIMEWAYRLGRSYYRGNDHSLSLEYYHRALGLSRSLQDHRFEARILGGIGYVFQVSSAYSEAINHFDQALAVFESLDDRPEIAQSRFNLGAVFDSMGEYRRALEYYQKADEAFHALKDPRHYRVLNNIGITYKNLAKYQEALDHYAGALSGLRQTGDRTGQAQTLNNIGVVYKELGQQERAIEYFEQSLGLARELGERRGQSILQGNLGEARKALGDYPRALDHLQRQLQLTREIGYLAGEGLALKDIGDIHVLLNRPRQAREHYEQALEIQRRIGARTHEGSTLLALADLNLDEGDIAGALRLGQQARALAEQAGSPELEWKGRYISARALRATGQPEEALANLNASIEMINSLRARILTDASKISYLDARQAVFHEWVDLLSQQGRVTEALVAAEGARSRALIDLLSAQQLTLSSGDAKQLDEIREVEAQLRAQAGPRPDEAAEAEMARRRAATENELEHRLRSLQGERGELASLVLAEPTSMKEITEIVKRLQATVVEYLVTERRLFVWVIKPSGDVMGTTVELGRERLRQLIRDLHRQLNEVDLAGLRDQRPVRAQLAELHRLTIAPVAPHLPRDADALVYFVPHDALLLMPFAALLDAHGRYLVEKHTLASAPSIGVLRYTVEKKRKVIFPDKPRVTVIADPPPPEHSDLGALPGARSEVQQIGRLFPPARVKILLGPSASEANVKRRSSEQTILHFAVHGVISDDRPWESALVLAGGDGDDGWLKVSEAFGLDLRANLVVLSGCSTGLGKLSGDGIIGLARAFIYAGTPSIVVSHWDVSDKATTFLMVRFYQGLIRGLSKARALRAAEVASLLRFRHPALWAAFELVGEAR